MCDRCAMCGVPVPGGCHAERPPYVHVCVCVCVCVRVRACVHVCVCVCKLVSQPKPPACATSACGGGWEQARERAVACMGELLHDFVGLQRPLKGVHGGVALGTTHPSPVLPGHSGDW